MALLDVNAASQYGARAQWAQNFFSSNYKIGQVAADTTENYTNTWGQGRTRTVQRNVDLTYGSRSRLSQGSASVSGSQFNSNTLSDNSRLDRIMQNASRSAPMKAYDPILPNGYRTNDNVRAGIDLRIDSSRVSDSGVVYITDSNASVGNGDITFQADDIARGGSGSLTFNFIPGGNPTFSLSYTQSTTIGTTTTSGSTTTSGNTQTASVNIFGTVDVVIGDKKKNGFSNTTSVDAGWKGAWSQQNSVNFSESSSSREANQRAVSVSVNLNGAERNSEGLYDYTYNVPQPDGSSRQGGVSFVPGRQYRASIAFVQTNVQNTITGNYRIGGSIGTLQGIRINSDGSEGPINSVSPTTAQALRNANNRRGSQYLSYDASSLGAVSNDQRSIEFRGSAVAGTRLNTDFTVMWHEVGSQNAALVNARSSPSLALQGAGNASGMMMVDLAKVDSDADDSMGVFMQTSMNEGEVVQVSGTGASDLLQASTKGVHTFTDFSSSFLFGNHQSDTFVFDGDDENNVAHGMKGDDTVEASASATAYLGQGDDTYIVNDGAEHTIRFGYGRDRLVLNSIDSATDILIGDFDILNDSVMLGDNVDALQFNAKLVEGFEGDPWSSYISFTYGDEQVAVAYITDDRFETMDYLSDPSAMIELAALNAGRLDFAEFLGKVDGNSMTSKQMMSAVVFDNRLFLNQKVTNHNDWEVMNLEERATVAHAFMQDLGSQRTVDDWMQLQSDEGADLSSANQFSTELLTNLMLSDPTIQSNMPL